MESALDLGPFCQISSVSSLKTSWSIKFSYNPVVLLNLIWIGFFLLPNLIIIDVMLQTAMLYPSVMFGTCFFLNFFILGKHSSGAVSATLYCLYCISATYCISCSCWHQCSKSGSLAREGCFLEADGQGNPYNHHGVPDLSWQYSGSTLSLVRNAVILQDFDTVDWGDRRASGL